MRVTVRAPATVANLGAGFDCVGVALAWFSEISVEIAPAGEGSVTVTGEGADRIPRDETNLTLRALRSVLGEGPAVRVHAVNSIPYGRGFGSSAAAIVAGLVAGEALGGHHERPLLAIATEIEGHADNVGPCLLGGAVVAGGARPIRLGAPAGISVLACVAPSSMSTGAARRALPAQVPFADAVASVRRAALLAAALATADASVLLEATDDCLHQPARFGLMPDSAALVGGLRAEGFAAFLSGAGPSVAALVPSARATEAEGAAARLAPDGWSVRVEAFDEAGARVVDRGA